MARRPQPKIAIQQEDHDEREEPFQITEVLPPVNYCLRLLVGWKQHDVFHAGLLTPYRENGTHGPNFTRPPPETIDDDKEWEVE